MLVSCDSLRSSFSSCNRLRGLNSGFLFLTSLLLEEEDLPADGIRNRAQKAAHFAKREIEMRENSSETVSIAPGFQLVASSDSCVNEIMQHKEKAIFGVQFHPEVSGNHGSILIENFVNHCIRPSYH